jgi:hypothetical protein
VTTLAELVTYIADLLCAHLEKYFICTALVVGFSGMERRGCLTLYRDLIKDVPYPLNPQATFGNWKFEVERMARDKPFAGSYKNAKLVYFVHANGDQMWLLVDENNRLVKKVPDQTLSNSKLQKGLDASIERARTQRKGQSTMIELQNMKPDSHKVTDSEWMPLYTVSDQRNISCWPISYLPPK